MGVSELKNCTNRAPIFPALECHTFLHHVCILWIPSLSITLQKVARISSLHYLLYALVLFLGPSVVTIPNALQIKLSSLNQLSSNLRSRRKWNSWLTRHTEIHNKEWRIRVKVKRSGYTWRYTSSEYTTRLDLSIDFKVNVCKTFEYFVLNSVRITLFTYHLASTFVSIPNVM